MMLAIWIFLKDCLIFIRDKQTFLLLVAMPLVLIAILGAALSGVVKDSSEEATLASFHIAVVDEDQSEQSTLFIDDILIGQLSTMLNVQKVAAQEVEESFKKDDVSLALYIPQGFGDKIDKHETPHVKVVTNGDASIEQSIISIALLHYQNADLAIDQMISTITATLTEQAKQTGVAPVALDFDEISASLNENGQSLAQAKVEQNARMGNQTVSSFQYYAVAMGVMYLIITVTILVGRILIEKEDPVYLRQFVSSLTARQYLIGKYLGLIVMVFLQLTVTVIGTRVLFKVHWGDSIISIIYTMVILTLSMSAVGLAIASFTKKAATFNNMSMIGTQIMAALGGSFVPIYLFPEWMVTLTKILPNALGLQMFLDIMTGATFADIWKDGVITLLISIVLFIIAWMRLGRKGGGIHA